MSFLERFKLQPKYKSADPDVRLTAVQELGTDPEDTAVLALLAREDADVRVRRAAAARVETVAVLAAIALSDSDEALRTETTERLIAMAAGDRPDLARQAAGVLRDQKHLAIVAKTSPIEAIRLETVAKITDPKALGSVARHAADARVAALAAERVDDPAELLTIALKTDHKDVGLSALERAASATTFDRETLDGVATRAKNKSVAKRARGMIQAIDEAEAARRAAVAERQRHISAVLARVESLASGPVNEETPARLAEAEAEWEALKDSDLVSPADEERDRFGAAVASACASIARAEQELANERERLNTIAASRQAREALCERVESLQGEHTLDDIAVARAEWEELPPLTEGDAFDAALVGRFEDACRGAIARYENRQELERVTTRLQELAREAEQLASREDSPGYAWESVAREFSQLGRHYPDSDASATARFTAAERTVKERAEAKREAAEKALRQQVHRVEQLIDRVAKRATAEDLTLREADRAARDLRAAIEAPPMVPHGERDALVDRLKIALSALAPRLHELREMDEWKRFANAAVQEELIAQTEALRTKYDLEQPEDVEKAARELHAIQERWKQAAEAPRAQAQTLWHRYRQAADPIQAKAREFFAHRAEERLANLQKKLALSERAEALADSTDWIKTADELKRLQLEWQAIGPVPRADTRVVWKRFRDACDRFFTRRNEDLARRKEMWAANQAKKEALCTRAEELAESREWERSAAEIRRLQSEWKTIGPVRRNKSEALWQRFRAACDRFFERYKRRDEIDLEARQADREALAQELESLLPADGSEAGPAPDLLERVRSLRTRWNQSTPAVKQGADPLSARFVAAMERLLAAYPDAFKGTELDIEASRHRMEKLCARVEGFVADKEATPAGSSQALADMLREALAANTIGGRAGEEAKWRAMADEVRQAQASWARLVPVPGDYGGQLAERFHRACNRFFEQYRRRVPPQNQPTRGRAVQTTR